MTNTDDNWPTQYSAGPKRPLHAVGVIASVYNDFDAGLFNIYAHHLKRKKVPEKISSRLYFQTSEDQRTDLIKFVFAECEKKKKVIDAVTALCSYYLWCWNTRNTLLHATIIPPLLGFVFGASDEHLLITKRTTRRGTEKGYAALTLTQLRIIADQMHIGDSCCIKLRWYLYCRDMPRAKWPVWLSLDGPQALPEIPAPPKEISLSALPRVGIERAPPLKASLRKRK